MPENLPDRLSIEHLKKQAKTLLKAFRRGDISTFRNFKPIKRYSELPEEVFFKSPIKLHDAQYAIALEYGFQSWQQLSDYCTQFNKEDHMSEKINNEFNQLKGLKNRAMQRLLRQVDSVILAMSLKDADEGLRQKISLNMTSRAFKLLKNDIDMMTNLSEAAIIKSKEKILAIYKQLQEEGEITKDMDVTERAPQKSEPVSILSKKKASQFNTEELKDFFYELSRKAYVNGLLQLESDAEAVDDDIIKKGLELITDGTDPSLVESILRSMLEKALHDFKVKYESSINAILDIQKGHYPELIKEQLDASL